jgi:peroxiredoxin
LILFGIVLPWLAVGFGCWLVYQLVRQYGRVLLRLEALEQSQERFDGSQSPAPEAPPGLSVGTLAPDFALPDLAGDRTALDQFRGRKLVLVFFNPRCGFCTRMAPDLAALPTNGAEDRPLPLLITTGTVEENRQLVREHGISCPVLRQEQMEVAIPYRVPGTPMGYLIDEQGRIASALAMGAPALLALATNAAGEHSSVNGRSSPVPRGNRPLSDSRIQRNGLPVGTPAPAFTLPRLDGGKLSLGAYRGRRVLLVFSSPKCGPCNELAPKLEQLARRTPEIQVLMVSRGEAKTNREKVAEHGITFPVALQKQWEISRRYAMFANPSAYLINEQGIIAADVAVGRQAILALLSSAAAETDGMATESRDGREVVPSLR